MTRIPPTRRGHETHEAISATQKAIRRSDPDAALYWALELAQSGFAPWCWKRLRIIAVEDCSPEAVGLVADVAALHEMWKADRGDGLLFLARAVISLAIAPKSRVVDWGLLHHSSQRAERREVPDEALDKHTLRGKKMGRGLEHFIDEASRLEPFTGDLADLEVQYRAQYRECARASAAAGLIDETEPVEPAQYSQGGPSGRLWEEDR